MNRSPYPPNPYSQGSPGEMGFRAQYSRPRHQTSPRFHQQFVPYSTEVKYGQLSNSNTPRSSKFTSPQDTKFKTPSPYNRSNNSGSGSVCYNDRFRNRGGFSPRYGIPHYQGNQFSPRENICKYYNPNMTKDPWEGLQAVTMKP